MRVNQKVTCLSGGHHPNECAVIGVEGWVRGVANKGEGCVVSSRRLGTQPRWGWGSSGENDGYRQKRRVSEHQGELHRSGYVWHDGGGSE